MANPFINPRKKKSLFNMFFPLIKIKEAEKKGTKVALEKPLLKIIPKKRENKFEKNTKITLRKEVLFVEIIKVSFWKIVRVSFGKIFSDFKKLCASFIDKSKNINGGEHNFAKISQRKFPR